ncbi:glycosyltransferase family 4 protein [Anaeromyxobacter oryzae]|uniref:Colanic acid biosynthesis glycosyltransferase WcaL n=1 Tax=Anaeromyxobacter oryzae TaxID=2918170 RepID=A0ABM7WYL4_9BACT|nr:glycosyltransferase family 4 protein [Anaeromyxobacter oryzae]BDG04626.1 colanic acid biosynthesis glycosyltransferase WcaL [Anaeromyxobacter oryzae]
MTGAPGVIAAGPRADVPALRPRIAYLVSQYPAPSHTFIRREIAALRRRGVLVDAYSIRPGECLSEADRAEQAGTFYVLRPPWRAFAGALAWSFARSPRRWFVTLAATMRHRLPGAAALVRSGFYFAEAMRLARELDRRRTTHLHDHFANAAAQVGLAAARYLGLGWSLSVHGLSDFDGPTAPLLAQKIAAAEFVACATRHGRARLVRLAPEGAWSKLHVVRCGVDPAALPHAEARRPPRPGEPLELVSVGRLAPEKGHAGLVEAFAEVLRRGVDARLTIVGGGSEEGRIRAAIAAHGVEGRVALRGRQPERVALEAMARAHVFVLSSLAEGLPVVLMEALALELPVVAPAIAGIPELVVHGETGLLYPAGDWRALADRVCALGADPQLRARLAAAGRARVAEEFDADRAAAPLATLFGARGPATAAAGGLRRAEP